MKPFKVPSTLVSPSDIIQTIENGSQIKVNRKLEGSKDAKTTYNIKSKKVRGFYEIENRNDGVFQGSVLEGYAIAISGKSGVVRALFLNGELTYFKASAKVELPDCFPELTVDATTKRQLERILQVMRWQCK